MILNEDRVRLPLLRKHFYAYSKTIIKQFKKCFLHIGARLGQKRGQGRRSVQKNCSFDFGMRKSSFKERERNPKETTTSLNKSCYFM